MGKRHLHMKLVAVYTDCGLHLVATYDTIGYSTNAWPFSYYWPKAAPLVNTSLNCLSALVPYTLYM